MYVYSWFIVLRESFLTVRLAVSEIKPVQSLTDRRTDRLTDRIVNYSNSRCACARGLIMYIYMLALHGMFPHPHLHPHTLYVLTIHWGRWEPSESSFRATHFCSWWLWEGSCVSKYNLSISHALSTTLEQRYINTYLYVHVHQ